MNIFGSNMNHIKSHNIRAILLALLKQGKLSRVELAKQLSLSSTTITNLTSELLREGIILEEQVKETGKPKNVGRPRRMLQLQPSARYAIGVHIGIGVIRIAITDLFARIVLNELRPFLFDTPPEEVILDIVQSIENLLREADIERDRIIGVGVGASGLVNYGNGVNVLAPRLGWKNVPIQRIIEEQLDLPVSVDNNVRAMALAEDLFGNNRGMSVLAFVYGRIGVGSGIVLNGQVFRGSGAGAGEIGHTTVIQEDGDKCTCGNTGCLETLLSEPVWIEHVLDLANTYPNSQVANYVKGHEELLLEHIFSAAREGDKVVLDYIEERACYLGIALANLVNILNPEVIILGGMFAQGSDLILPIAEAKMKEKAFGRLGENVKVQTTSFGWRAGVVGAAALALTKFFYYHPGRS